MRALILSAGLGERLRPLTNKKAKPALEFLNVPMLGFPYHWLETLGLSDVTFNTHYLPDTIRHAAMHVTAPEIQLHFTHEDAILGSGGGIWNARFFLQGLGPDRTFAVANGDGVIVSSRPELLREMLAYHRREHALATLLVCPLAGVGSKLPGVWVHPNGEVAGFGTAEKMEQDGLKGARSVDPKAPLECLHYASYMLFAKELWSLLPDGSSNILYDVLEPHIGNGARVRAFRVSARDMQWFETGNATDYLDATRRCLEYLRDDHPFAHSLRQILEHHGPAFEMQSRLREMKLIADSATIDPSARLHGFVVVGPECHIPAGCELENCVLLPGARLPEGAITRGAVVVP
ncbi:MAG: sugar phosphate nucleotidyltransferase [Bdellovibrionales bacterium]